MNAIDRKKFSILYVATKEIKILDIPSALDEIGYEVYKASLTLSIERFDEKECQTMIHILNHYKVQYVISYDFSESIAQACFETDIPYISWVYDSPQKELYTHYAQYPSNYIFVFDKMQEKRIREIGIKNVFYMPLAILPNKVQYLLEKGSKREETAQIVFIGQLYKNDNLNKIVNEAEEKIRQSLEKNIAEICLLWKEDSSVHGKMEDVCVDYFSNVENGRILEQYPYMTEQLYYEAAVTSRLVANRERVAILNALAEKHNVRFYTKDRDTSQLSEKVTVLPPVSYDAISQIYCNSKINLNITLHCIESGVNQRVFDVMAAGGFMLSNYQKELEELFIDGEEIVLYHNLEELVELADYYLIHEEERKEIARKGQEKVWKYHDLHDRMKQVMELVTKEESNRKKPYIIIQSEWLYEKVEKLLSEGTSEAYQQLKQLLKDRKYETIIKKTAKLQMLYEMVNCWNIETKSNIFTDVKNIKDAGNKYLRIKHGLWRIEGGIREDKCLEAIYQMYKKQDSILLITNIIKNNLDNRKEVFIITSQYMQKYSMANAIELLTYGIRFYPKCKNMTLQLANCYMEIGMWDRVLETLQKIEDWDEEIRELMLEIQNILGENKNE